MIIWDGLVTFVILKGIGLFTSLRMSDAELAVGDMAMHGEEAYPEDEPDESAPDREPALAAAASNGHPEDPRPDSEKVMAD